MPAGKVQSVAAYDAHTRMPAYTARQKEIIHRIQAGEQARLTAEFMLYDKPCTWFS